MFCKYCGVEIKDDSLFCANCGQKVDTEMSVEEPHTQESTVLEEQAVVNDCENETMANEPLSDDCTSPNNECAILAHSKPKKMIIIGVIVVLLVVLVAGAIFLFGNSTSAGSAKVETTTVSAKLTDDGTAYLPMFDGTCVVINDEVEAATISKDREHIVVLLKDGTLYVTDKNQSAKTEIVDNCESISNVRNDGFFYSDDNDDVYRILFSDFSSQKLGNDAAFVVAENNTSVIYATDEGGVYTMSNTEKEGNKISTYTNSIELEAISDNGEISVWVTEKNDIQTIMLNDGDDKVTLGEVDYDYNYTYVTFTEDQGLVVIRNSYSDCMWIKVPGQETIEAKLGSEPADITIFTNEGYLSDMQSGSVDSLYISTEADSGSNVYNISLSGDRERILSKVSNYYIANGNIVYTDMENTLFSAKLDGNSIVNEMKVASDVDMFELTDNGQYVYYMKDCEDETGSLYCYKIGESDPVKVATDVACYNSNWSDWMYTTYSTNGTTVFFFKDMEEIPDTYTEQGTLMVWNYGEDGANKISSDVVNYSVTSSLETGEVNAKNFMFMKYSSVDADENIYVNWMYHNGTEATKLATDVIR